MRIAVISDTHNRLPEHVLGRIQDADEIWHLGDVTGEAVLIALEKLGPPVRVVRGNCDANEDWPVTSRFEIDGWRVHLEHIPPRVALPGTDLLLHGHTHVPRDEMVGGTRFLNPGTTGGPSKGAPPSYAWLILEAGQPVSWKIMPV